MRFTDLIHPTMPPKKRGQTAPQCGALTGKVLCLTGKFSQSRAELETAILAAGGEVATSITKKVNILVSNTQGTKKCQDAEAKGIEVVDEDWLLQHLQEAETEEEEVANDEADEPAEPLPSIWVVKFTRPKKIFYFATNKSSQGFIKLVEEQVTPSKRPKVEELTVNDVYEEWKNDDGYPRIYTTASAAVSMWKENRSPSPRKKRKT